MIIGLDIDGVVADFLSSLLLRVGKKIGNGPIPADSITELNSKKALVVSGKGVWKCTETISGDPEFWRNLASLISPNEWQFLESLSRQQRLIFITHREIYGRETHDIRRITRDWLKTHGIGEPAVHFTRGTKSNLVKSLGIQLFVDDCYENCQEVAENTQAIVLMPSRSYNQSFSHPKVKNIRNFSGLFAHLPKASKISPEGT